jgi:ketosteroid isomerase-like protein
VHPNEALVRRLYDALGRKDGDAMAACYTKDAWFSDPVFPSLRGDEVGAMWRMLCAGATDLRVEVSDVRCDDVRGSAHWEAWYTFSRTGRPVHNVGEARYVFRDGLVERHEDAFDFPRWAAQALGWVGRLFGRMHQVKDKVRKDARRRLAGFQSRPPN